MIDSIKINGKDIITFAIVSKDTEKFASPIKVLARYLKKYAGIVIPTGNFGEVNAENYIVFGDDSCSAFESAIYMKGNMLYLAASTLSSAENVCDRFIGEFLSEDVNDINIPTDGTPVFKTLIPDWFLVPKKITLQDQLVRACKKIQHLLEYDDARGLPFTYQHLGTVNSNIMRARMEDNRTVNCVILLNWVAKDNGLWNTGILNIKYDGTMGYTFSNEETEKAVRKNFDIIEVNKSIRDIRAEGNLLPGDLISFQDHMQVIVDQERALDGGRGNTDEIAVGSRFHHFLRENICLGYKCGFIFRAKDAVKDASTF